MSWILQPHNWTQALQRNLYNVGYRRNQVYKGMGACTPSPDNPWTMQGDPMCGDITTDPTAWGWNIGGPESTDMSTGPSTTPTGSKTGTPATAAPNWTPFLLLGGGLLLVALIARR